MSSLFSTLDSTLSFIYVVVQRHSLTAIQMVGSEPMPLKNRPRDMKRGFCPEIPAAFASFVQARNSLDFHWNRCIWFLYDLEKNDWPLTITAISGQGPFNAPRTPELARRELLDIFDRWLVAFQSFEQEQGTSWDSRAFQAAHILEMSHSLAVLFLNLSSVKMSNDETVWDRFTQHHERMLNLASLVVEPLTRDDLTGKQGSRFTFDMDYVALLYCVAHRCRHPVIRRKAVSLLYAVPRQEGIWDSVLTARVAEKLISIEEAGLGNVTRCEDVPNWARISEVSVSFDLQGRLGTIKYSRQRSPSEKIQDTVTDVMRW